MEDDCAFFASGVPASIGDAVRTRGAVFGLLEEGADVVSGWEGDLGEVPRGTECFGKGVGVLGVDCFFPKCFAPVVAEFFGFFLGGVGAGAVESYDADVD